MRYMIYGKELAEDIWSDFTFGKSAFYPKKNIYMYFSVRAQKNFWDINMGGMQRRSAPPNSMYLIFEEQSAS